MFRQTIPYINYPLSERVFSHIISSKVISISTIRKTHMQILFTFSLPCDYDPKYVMLIRDVTMVWLDHVEHAYFNAFHFKIQQASSYYWNNIQSTDYNYLITTFVTKLHNTASIQVMSKYSHFICSLNK